MKFIPNFSFPVPLGFRTISGRLQTAHGRAGRSAEGRPAAGAVARRGSAQAVPGIASSTKMMGVGSKLWTIHIKTIKIYVN